MQKATRDDKERIMSYLEKDCVNCLYMYADISKYGTDGPHMSVWYDTDDLGLRMVVMKYHRNFQIYASRGFDQVDGALPLIQQEKPLGISARKEIIETLVPKLEQFYRAEYGVIFRGKPLEQQKLLSALEDCDVQMEQAGIEDATEIARLLCMDKELGCVYTVNSLTQELEDRIQTGMGRSYVIRNNGHIVAHNATYAECNRFVVISGLMVHPDYRDTDYAYWIDLKSSIEFQQEGKDRYFFAMNPKIIRWHKRIGSILSAEYGKLSLFEKGSVGGE